MTIVNFETETPISGVLSRGERGRKYALILKRLPAADLQAMRDELDSMIASGDIFTSSWMPGSDWSNTPFQPLYDRAAQRDHQTSAMMFGLLVWEAFDRHPEVWFTGKFEKDGIPLTVELIFNQPDRAQAMPERVLNRRSADVFSQYLICYDGVRVRSASSTSAHHCIISTRSSQ